MNSDISETPLYNIAAAVQQTGVPATTIRAWERRYGYPVPHRDAAGVRLYSDKDIHTIRVLVDQTAQGVSISRAVEIVRGGHSRPGYAARVASIRSFEALRDDLARSLLGLEAGRADALLAEAFALYSVEDACMQILEPLLVDVGDRWHAGQLSVAEEHYVSSFVRSHLFALLLAYQGPDLHTPLVFTACAPDEWHEVGILIVSIFLARRAYNVRYLGPNLPLEDLAAIAARHHPAVVVLSAQSRETARKLRGVQQALEQGTGPHPRLAFGGQAFNADAHLRGKVDGTYVGPDAAASVAAITEMVDRADNAASPRGRSSGRRLG